MDQCAEVPSAEVVSVMEKDSYETASFERFHDHAVPHNIPCRHFAGRLTLDCDFVLITEVYDAFLWADKIVITTITMFCQS